MSNVDIEIYMTNLVKFFDKNPEQLKILIGDNDSNIFFQKIRKIVETNEKDEKELAPTRKQMIEIILEVQKNATVKKLDRLQKIARDNHTAQASRHYFWDTHA